MISILNSALHWDDLRYVGAIVETKSLSGAARLLKTSHATVYRHLRDAEIRLGVRLFDRTSGGYQATEAGLQVAELATRFAAEIAALEREVAGEDVRHAGVVRLTTTDTLYHGLLAVVLTEFCHVHKSIDLELIVSNNLFNIARRDADIAIRPASMPDESLYGRRLGVIEQAIYGAVNSVDRWADLNSAPWIGPDETMVYPALDRWMRQTGYAARCRFRSNSVLAMHRAAQSGAGLAVLPCYLAESDESLRRVGPIVDTMAIDLWLLTHEQIRRQGRIDVVMKMLGARIPALLRAAGQQ